MDRLPHTRLHTFHGLFEDDNYLRLKNFLYNYLLRKKAVEKSLAGEHPVLLLELGCGISPTMTRADRIIYADSSLRALQILRATHGKGWYVVSDGACLPFKPEVFTHAVCSEVLEHLVDDRAAVKELARVIALSGQLVVTFPHRKFYFANDDRFVQHVRRYELSEMEDRLKAAGLQPLLIQKVLGPLEKITMCVVIFCFSLLKKFRPNRKQGHPLAKFADIVMFLFKWSNRFYAGFVWLDATVMPRALAATLLIKAEKHEETLVSTQ